MSIRVVLILVLIFVIFVGQERMMSLVKIRAFMKLLESRLAIYGF